MLALLPNKKKKRENEEYILLVCALLKLDTAANANHGLKFNWQMICKSLQFLKQL